MSSRQTLTLVTYNVWFGNYHRADRQRALLSILRQADADIIGLQEVTPGFLRTIMDEPWIARDYRVGEVSVSPYGVLMLARVPVERFTLHRLPSAMGRKLLVAELAGRDSPAVATVHLESLDQAAVRKEQLDIIFPILDAYPHAVLMGDFNHCGTWDENQNLDPRYLDIWPNLRPGEPGWTEDTDINTMRLLVDPTPTQVRFDRVIVRSTGGLWQPIDIERLGTEPIAADLPDVFPSDHFGLRAVLERRG